MRACAPGVTSAFLFACAADQINKLNIVANKDNNTYTTFVRNSPNNMFAPGYMGKFDIDTTGLAAALAQATNNAAAGTWALNFTVTQANLAGSVQNRCMRGQGSRDAAA